jgi:hypothetical protein
MQIEKSDSAAYRGQGVHLVPQNLFVNLSVHRQKAGTKTAMQLKTKIARVKLLNAELLDRVQRDGTRRVTLL